MGLDVYSLCMEFYTIAKWKLDGFVQPMSVGIEYKPGFEPRSFNFDAV